MRARYVFLSAFVASLLVFGGSQVGARPHGWSRSHGIDGSGDLMTKELDLPEFDEIDVGGCFEVHVTFGREQKVELTVDDNLFEYLDIEVRGGILELDFDRNLDPSEKPRLEIVARRLEAVSVHGAGNLEVEDFAGERFEFNLSGAGNLDIDGSVDELDVQLSGAGDVDARDLKARRADVQLSGAGSATLTVTDRLRARISGVGNLTYYGDPEDRDVHVSGLGSVRRR
jgi:hypothetical protein